jgi:hypothetical protein
MFLKGKYLKKLEGSLSASLSASTISYRGSGKAVKLSDSIGVAIASSTAYILM